MRYDAVIIGAGLGGLSAGAFLAKAGKKVLVLEKTDAIGGRCRTVEMMGHRFDIGADYFGGKMLDAYKALGKADKVGPVYFRTLADTEGKTMTFPPGLRTIGELGGMGMSLPDIATLGYRMAGHLLFGSYSTLGNNYLLINQMTGNEHLRDIFNIGAFFTGNEPENMPVYWFKLLFGRTYGYDKPFYPRGGAGVLPELLAEVIRENGGGIVYNAAPERIVVEGGRARGVVWDGRMVEADNVISGISIQPTVHTLTGKEHFPSGLLDTLGYYREGLAMASVFVVFKRAAKLTKGVHIYARFPKNMYAMFRVLNEGRFPDKNMFVLSCPDAITGAGGETLAATIKFLVPKGGVPKEKIAHEAGKILKDVDMIVPDFHASIVDKAVYAPEDYAREFGFTSLVSPVAESVNYEKTGVELPLGGLYCAGSTVLPVGGCTVSSVESGRLCAEKIIGVREKTA